MTLQAISKGFEHFKNVGLKFSLYIFPLIILFGFLASLGSASSFSGDISNADITLLLLNNFLVSPLVTIVAILLANDLIENNNRDVLVYYAISWKFLIKILILSLITTMIIGIGLILFIIPGILFAGFLLFVNYFAILENKSVMESIISSYEKSKSNFLQCILMASFFWIITILSITSLSSLGSGYASQEQIPQIFTIFASCLAIYVQVCLISFPILIFYRKQKLNKIED